MPSLSAASAFAPEADRLFFALVLASVLVLGLVFGLILVFCIRYRAGSKIDRGQIDERSWRAEITWTTATLMIFLGLFVWGAVLYAHLFQVPPDALQIDVVGKQWMWKIQHPDGQREINTLHVPVDRAIRLVMTSEDVIHSFFVPDFRIKRDVLPGRYTSLWFIPTETGSFPLRCTQFCGVDHAVMAGEVVVMSDANYEHWLQAQPSEGSLVAQGDKLFRAYGCSGCHSANSTIHAPPLEGVFGRPVHLDDGRTLIADNKYLRDCILIPATQRVAGYPPVMPAFAGQVSEGDLLSIIAYIKSLSDSSGPVP
jgi:cytochrome c oxidase subunit II